MAAPAQKQYVEKPRKVLAAPYDPTADPPQPGVCLCYADPDHKPPPHVHVYPAMLIQILAPNDMITFDAVFPDRLIACMTIPEFEAVYGNVANPLPEA
jgi:hypothetical protein